MRQHIAALETIWQRNQQALIDASITHRWTRAEREQERERIGAEMAAVRAGIEALKRRQK